MQLAVWQSLVIALMLFVGLAGTTFRLLTQPRPAYKFLVRMHRQSTPLLVFRLVAFSLFLIVFLSSMHTSSWHDLVYYTYWTFALETFYWGAAIINQVHCWFTHVDTVSQPLNALFDVCFTVVLVVAAVFWGVLYNPATTTLAWTTYVVHGVNVVAFVVEFAWNDLLVQGRNLQFVVMWPAIYGAATMVGYNTYLHGTWPYALLDVSKPQAPLKWLGIIVGHVVVFGLVCLFSMAKRRLVPAPPDPNPDGKSPVVFPIQMCKVVMIEHAHSDYTWPHRLLGSAGRIHRNNRRRSETAAFQGVDTISSLVLLPYISMNQTELRSIRDAFNRRYAKKREWPLRVDYPRVASSVPTPVTTRGSVSPADSDLLHHHGGTYETVSFVLRDAINDGFAFTFDRMGNGLVVLDVDKDACPTLSVGSILVSINGDTVCLDETVEVMVSNDPNHESIEQKVEAVRLQMINLFKHHGVSPKAATPCHATFVQTPTKLEVVQKWHPHSTYKPWSTVYLKLQCGYLNYYPSLAKAEAATVNSMQESLVGVNVVYCTVTQANNAASSSLSGYCFIVTENPPKQVPVDDEATHTDDEGLPHPDDTTTMAHEQHDDASNVSNQQNASSSPPSPPSSPTRRGKLEADDADDADPAALDELMAILGTKSVIVEKVVVHKAPTQMVFRVKTAAQLALWLQHIDAAQTFRAEDYVKQPKAT
ncbi:Aste57867_20096 [Aphanomyces stellatus]|uniref:Aste57867_20096 protein n=1 Tax=Aphanomyces stellatus TaxID=120398 RepID=A0A485LFD4_9STRA|nr:hypothetical protein As57867_020030 [Aphanomyces stellatus]VFT96791.1 Aste57867_20096 [Aphanomyces stellatus]